MKDVYISKVASYLPNSPIENDQMESFIGFIGGKPSRDRSIVLRQNGIKTRYYGIDKSQKMTHTNALLAKNAVCSLFVVVVVISIEWTLLIQQLISVHCLQV
jgi:3-oxoacyl-[acyl-carrier-protein] synthase-3